MKKIRIRWITACRKIGMRTAERTAWVSVLVRRFLTSLANGESQSERLASEERDLCARIRHFRAADRLTRDIVHKR